MLLCTFTYGTGITFVRSTLHFYIYGTGIPLKVKLSAVPRDLARLQCVRRWDGTRIFHAFKRQYCDTIHIAAYT